MKKILLLLLVQSICHANIIDGNTDVYGRPRDVSLNNIEIGGLYTDALTTSIKNHTLTNVSGQDRIWTFTSVSKLVLENSTLDLDGTLTFSHGVIQIVGNCAINGSSDFNKFRYEGHLIHISEGSELRIGPGVNFEYAPTGSTRKGIRFSSSSSKLTLEDSTFTVSNGMGLNLVNGQIRIEGNSVIDSFFTEDNVKYLDRNIAYTDAALVLGYGSTNYGDCKLKIASGAKLNVKNAGIIYRNNGADGFDASEGGGILKIDKKGSFISYLDDNFLSSGVEVDKSLLNSKRKQGAPISLEYITGYDAGVDATADARSIAWHPSGRYLATGVINHSSNYDVVLLSFDGSSLSSIANYNFSDATTVWPRGACFSNSGKYLAIGSFVANPGDGYSTYVLYFSETDPELYYLSGTYNINASASGVWDNKDIWSPDDRYISCASNITTAKFGILGFDGTSTSFNAANQVTYASGYYLGTSWSRDGKYVTASAANSSGTRKFYVYRFENGVIVNGGNPVAGIDVASTSDAFASPNFSEDGRFITIVSSTGEVEVYKFDGSSLTLLGSYSHGGDASVGNINTEWFMDGRYILAKGFSDYTCDIYPFDGEQRVGSAFTRIVNSDLSGDYTYMGAGFISPDGKHLAMATKTNNTNELRIYKINYNEDDSKVFSIKNATIKLTKNTTLRDINLKMK